MGDVSVKDFLEELAHERPSQLPQLKMGACRE